MIAPKLLNCASPALSPLVATPLLRYPFSRAGVILVCCCMTLFCPLPSKATTYYFCRFFLFVNSPLQVKRQHTPHKFHPSCISSPMPFPMSTSSYGWLLCPPIIWQPTKAKGPQVSRFFFIDQFGDCSDGQPFFPHVLPQPCLLSNSPLIVATNYWCIVVYSVQTIATEG